MIISILILGKYTGQVSNKNFKVAQKFYSVNHILIVLLGGEDNFYFTHLEKALILHVCALGVHVTTGYFTIE